jgi:hypothetical protein
MSTEKPHTKYVDVDANGQTRVLRFFGRLHVKRFIEAYEHFMQLNPAQMVKSCISCDHFNESTEMCKLVNARPPAKIIAFACEKYDNMDDEIPF